MFPAPYLLSHLCKEGNDNKSSNQSTIQFPLSQVRREGVYLLFSYSILRRDRDKNVLLCALCKSVNPVDPVSGIEALRRVKKRKYPDENRKICPEHGQEFIMFCKCFMQLICPGCLISDAHKNHKDSDHVALEDAQRELRQSLQSYMESLKSKRVKVDSTFLLLITIFTLLPQLVNFTQQLSTKK